MAESTTRRTRSSRGNASSSDPVGGTKAAHGRYPVKMYEPAAAADAPDDIVYVVLGSLQLGFVLLWVDADPLYPLPPARQALDLLPDAQLRVLDRAGFLVAYDDPVGLARELISFCG